MNCPWPIEITLSGGVNKGKKQLVPCGKCGLCLQARRNDWAIRIKEEQRVSLNSFFITLTYQEENLTITDTGFPTLVKKDLQDFLKRLRKRVDAMDIKDFNYHMATKYESHEDKRKACHGIRYYAIGEYGEKFERPHYHIILFNVPEMVVQSLDQNWKKGNIHAGSVSIKSIMYCLSYHITRNPKVSMEYDRAPEFVTMSRRPGIGHSYIKDRSKWNIENELLYTVNDGFKMRLPRFWKVKIWSDEKRAELTEKLLLEMKEKQKKVIEEAMRLEGLGFVEAHTYMHDLKVKEANRQYKKVVKGKTF